MKNTILNLSQWETRVSDWFSMVTLCKMTHADLMAHQAKTIDAELNRKWSNGRRVYSAYVSGYVQGLITARRAQLWREYLEFCYVEPDGTLVSTHKTSTHKLTETYYAAGKGHILPTFQSGHFWRESNKPF